MVVVAALPTPLVVPNKVERRAELMDEPVRLLLLPLLLVLLYVVRGTKLYFRYDVSGDDDDK